jgi:hypothetical protein
MLFLGLKFVSAPQGQGIKMTVTVQLRFEGTDKPQPYNKKEMATALADAQQKAGMLTQQFKEAEATKNVPQNKAKEFAEFKTGVKQEMDFQNKRAVRIENLTQYISNVQGSTAIHFRVFYQADDYQVNLLFAGDPPAPPRPGAKAAPAPAAKAPEAKDASKDAKDAKKEQEAKKAKE